MLPRLVLYSWAQVIFRRALCSQVSRNMPQCPLVSLLKAPFSESRLGFTLPFNIVSISFHSLHICMVSEKFNVITPVFAPEEIRLFIHFILCLSRWVFFSLIFWSLNILGVVFVTVDVSLFITIHSPFYLGWDVLVKGTLGKRPFMCADVYILGANIQKQSGQWAMIIQCFLVSAHILLTARSWVFPFSMLLDTGKTLLGETLEGSP